MTVDSRHDPVSTIVVCGSLPEVLGGYARQHPLVSPTTLMARAEQVCGEHVAVRVDTVDPHQVPCSWPTWLDAAIEGDINRFWRLRALQARYAHGTVPAAVLLAQLPDGALRLLDGDERISAARHAGLTRVDALVLSTALPADDAVPFARVHAGQRQATALPTC